MEYPSSGKIAAGTSRFHPGASLLPSRRSRWCGCLGRLRRIRSGTAFGTLSDCRCCERRNPNLAARVAWPQRRMRSSSRKQVTDCTICHRPPLGS
jgi:hypothetical protein